MFAGFALLAWTALSFCVRKAMQGAPLLRTTASISSCNALLMIPVAFALLLLQGIAKLLRDILVVVKGEEADVALSKEKETL